MADLQEQDEKRRARWGLVVSKAAKRKIAVTAACCCEPDAIDATLSHAARAALPRRLGAGPAAEPETTDRATSESRGLCHGAGAGPPQGDRHEKNKFR